MTARPLLWWALGAAVALSAWALLSPPSAPPALVQPAESRAAQTPSSSDEPETRPAALAAATVDLFTAPSITVPTLPVPAAPPQAPAALIAVSQIQTPLAPPPPAPPSFAGRMVGPGGERLVFLRDGADLQVAVVGQSTRTGYRVEAITERSVRLVQPAFDQAVDVAIPDQTP